MLSYYATEYFVTSALQTKIKIRRFPDRAQKLEVQYDKNLKYNDDEQKKFEIHSKNNIAGCWQML